jgi:predicted dehydrogenase
MESVHHLYKQVAGRPIKRPPWYFDTEQQGEGLVDVTTHLVDLIQWICFPEQVLDYQKDIDIIQAHRWPTWIDGKQFQKMTRLSEFPDYLQKRVNEQGLLPFFCNGEMIYTIRGIHARVQVMWNFESAHGEGETHLSVIQGSKSRLIIRQGKTPYTQPELFIENHQPNLYQTVKNALINKIEQWQKSFPGISFQEGKTGWQILIPTRFRVGHERHFAQVMENYLRFLKDGHLPEWEISYMLAKYYTTTQALAFTFQTTPSEDQTQSIESNQ